MLRSVALWKKIKLLSQCNKNIRAFMHRFCNILYEIRHVIKINNGTSREPIDMKLGIKWWELIVQNKGKNLKNEKLYIYFITKIFIFVVNFMSTCAVKLNLSTFISCTSPWLTILKLGERVRLTLNRFLYNVSCV